MKKLETWNIPAIALTTYDRYIAKYPHLATVANAKAFCHAALQAEAPKGLTPTEALEMAQLAHGEMPKSIINFDKL